MRNTTGSMGSGPSPTAGPWRWRGPTTPRTRPTDTWSDAATLTPSWPTTRWVPEPPSYREPKQSDQLTHHPVRPTEPSAAPCCSTRPAEQNTNCGPGTWWWPTGPTPGSAGPLAPNGTGPIPWAWPSAATSRAPSTTTRGSSPPWTSGTGMATPCPVTAGSSRWATGPSTLALGCCPPSGTTRTSTPATCSRSSPGPCPSTGRSTRPVPSPRQPVDACPWPDRWAPRPGPTGWWSATPPAR